MRFLVPAVALAVACGCGGSHDNGGPGGPDAGSGGPRPDGGGQGSGDPGWTVDEFDVAFSTIEAVRFSDAQHGFLTASDGGARGLHVTSDGGATWQSRELDVIPYGVGASPSQTAVLAAGSGTRPVWTSTDRGASFAPVTWTLGGWPADLRFLDDQTVVMGDEVGDRVFRSADGGLTWTVHLFTREVLPGTHHVESLGASNAWIIGGPAFRGDGTGATIAYSSDAAQTWTITNLTDNAHLFKGGGLRGIAVVSTSELWVAGDNRQLFHTTDGMQTWTQFKGAPAEILHFLGIAVRGNVIAIVGSAPPFDYVLYRSTDGGATFQIVDRRAAPDLWDAGGIHGVTATSNGDLFAYGYDGVLWRYVGALTR